MNLLLIFLFGLIFTQLAYTKSTHERQLKSDTGDNNPQNKKAGTDGQAERTDWSRLGIRYGKRNEIFSPDTYPDPTEDEDILRPARDPAKNNYHIRFGRGNSNFIRYGRTSGEKEIPKSKGNNKFNNNNFPFIRFRRGGNDFIRFGRSVGYLDDQLDEKRGNSNFLRFGKRSDREDYVEDDEREDLNDQMREVLFWRYLAEVPDNVD